MTLERARSYAGTFPKRSIYIAAFLNRKMIGFLKLVLDKEGHYANIMAILSLISERDKSPTNALIAHAVKVCAERGISQLAYDHFSYGEKVADSLAEF